jgi:hypothetical protein
MKQGGKVRSSVMEVLPVRDAGSLFKYTIITDYDGEEFTTVVWCYLVDAL